MNVSADLALQFMNVLILPLGWIIMKLQSEIKDLKSTVNSDFLKKSELFELLQLHLAVRDQTKAK